jgi:phosphoglycolate phosphatase
MAAAAGVPALAVSFGAHPREALDALAPLSLLDSTAALAQWLKANG